MVRDTKKMQIYDLLKERIENGFYPPGSQLPKEVELAEELAVSRVTLRPALELLELEQLIRRVKGLGTFVREERRVNTRVMVLCTTVQGGPEKISNPFIHILPSLQQEADRMNVALDICDMQSLQGTEPNSGAARILERGIQGIFWLGSNFNGHEPLLETVRKTGLPVLLPHANFTDADITGFTVMGTNYRELICDGLKYLAAQGHRRVAYISGPDMHQIALSDYFAEVRNANLDPDPELLRRIEWRKGKQLVFDTVAGLMNMVNPPTAIFSYSDYLSLQIYEYLHWKKIRIPEDVCVLTTGGQIGCDFLNPRLSALEYGSRTIAELAVKTMLQMIRDGRRMKFIVTPHRLVVRESTMRIILHHTNRTKLKKEVVSQ